MGNKSSLYPLRFTPILKEKVWGGSKLTTAFNKKGGDRIGESWELSAVQNAVSVVENGPLKNKTLEELLHTYAATIVGNKVYERYKHNFPLLFKFIDANETLSVQLHPNDSLAKTRHDSFGKTELWYIMEAEPKANLIIGFDKTIDKAAYLKHLSEETLPNILNEVQIEAGDAYYIAPGTVHAIGSGVVLAEIQQTSDITYRIYDWDRPDTTGELRELHTDLALDAINFTPPTAKITYEDKENHPVLLKHTPYFEINKLKLSEDLERAIAPLDSFVVYMCVDGQALIQTETHSEAIQKGQTILIPAAIDRIKIKTTKATLLEVYIP
ncbi:MAG: class I mannose-6-phosphate isomerase [Flavobacteriales bacterium]|jgi:mannose-6-phosphate isomerase|uniref:type I phosphomannose isomerase catalytic subunit n=1 Tax=Candidatus Ulvibacter alkanivorans TaxID=2267620 RepID=UPI000DF325BF|nr:type I phosphomannose isomerase catalytic subunit [Candidatus Ulvibacter alkanivorans]MCH2491135.1 class I mannose-6-phosphate isomerase [Flavobacteriales bacterium]